MKNLPGGTVTLVFTDIEGSTRLLQALGDDYGKLLAQHRRVLRESAADVGGTEIDNQGDAFFFSFTRARDAVDAALAAQQRFETETWPGNAEVRVRMGVHTGEPVVGEEGYLGIDVVRAARIAGAAHGGQVLISETSRALLPAELPGAEISDLGRHTLKDFEQAERLFQVAPPGAPVFPPLRADRALEPAGDLDTRLESFINRRLSSLLGSFDVGRTESGELMIKRRGSRAD